MNILFSMISAVGCYQKCPVNSLECDAIRDTTLDQQPGGAMLLLLILILFASSEANTACGSKQETTPSVTPFNSTHVKVSWRNVFYNCKKTDIYGVVIYLKEKNKEVLKAADVNMEEEYALLKLNPCSQLILNVKYNFTKTYNELHGYPMVERFVEYNRNTSYENVYGGLLQQKLCKKNGKVPVPKNLTSCVRTFKQEDQSDTVFISMKVEKTNKTEDLEQNEGELRIETTKKLDEIPDCPPSQDTSDHIFILVWIVMGLSFMVMVVILVLACLRRAKEDQVAWGTDSQETPQTIVCECGKIYEYQTVGNRNAPGFYGLHGTDLTEEQRWCYLPSENYGTVGDRDDGLEMVDMAQDSRTGAQAPEAVVGAGCGQCGGWISFKSRKSTN